MKITDEMIVRVRNAIARQRGVGESAAWSYDPDALVAIKAVTPLILEEAARLADIYGDSDAMHQKPDRAKMFWGLAEDIRSLSPTSHTSPEE